jgi:diguanylate cyclase (GGDEF)-like protein
MSSAKKKGTQTALQSLLLKRFGMAAATYGLTLLVFAVLVVGGQYQAEPSTAVLCASLVIISQLVFFGIFLSGANLRFSDPSLTAPQVLIALSLLTYLMYNLHSARGTMLVFYLLILLFGVFQLAPRVFARCAAFAFFGFALVNLWDAFQMRLPDPKLAALQVGVLAVMLVWLSLFAGYVQALRQRMRQRRFALQAHQDTLRGMMRQLEDLVATDELTGLFNRRHFLRLAARELENLGLDRRHGLALIDLDHFKRINDQHGHASGDRVLQTFATVAQACLRDGDVLARYGGEEFVLLLPNTDADQLTACCERLREAFAGAEPVGVKVDSISLSAGMTLLEAGDDLDEALHRADQALYRAKHSGRNCCHAAWEGSGA